MPVAGSAGAVFGGQPWVIGNTETDGTLASFTFLFDGLDLSQVCPTVLGVDFGVSGVVPNTLIAQWGWSDGSIIYADAQTFEAGRTTASWRGQMPWPAGLSMVASANTTVAVAVSVFAWGVYAPYPSVALAPPP